MTQIQHFQQLIEADIFADHIVGEVYFSKDTILELLEISQQKMLTSTTPTISDQISALEAHLNELITENSKKELIQIIKAQIQSLKEISYAPYGC